MTVVLQIFVDLLNLLRQGKILEGRWLEGGWWEGTLGENFSFISQKLFKLIIHNWEWGGLILWHIISHTSTDLNDLVTIIWYTANIKLCDVLVWVVLS